MSAITRIGHAGGSANPHLLGALGLAILICLAAMAVMLFGDPQRAAPRAVVSVPAPAPQAGAEIGARIASSGLRGVEEGLDDPMLDILAAPPEDSADITLPGVTPIDEEAPVRTSTELAAAERAAERPGLPRAPIDGLTAPGPNGPLPAVGPTGTRPAEAYARPFTDPGLPRLALIVGGLGWDADATRRAIRELPPEVTLGFSPYAANLQNWIDDAREAGHEVVIEIPMEPFDYPDNDPGEHTLLTSIEAGENIDRLDWLMSRGAGYFAVMNYMGERFFAADPALEPVFAALAERGVDLVYDGARSGGPVERVAAQTGLGWAPTDRAIDADLTADGVQRQLAQLEALALQNGAAMGAGFAYPVVIDQAIAWAEAVQRRGYTLAPASAVMAEKRAAR